ncbi:hypothetical protein HZC07_03580 [Candidatus Micrarchaeota archaeon]|nr:hypothetical protein [Candidatus Micrarchaeota archaeon]
MKVCILCEKEVHGSAHKIKEDRIIATVRKIKKMFKIAKMNELYVCQEDFEKHRKRREEFETSVLFSTVLGGLLGIILVVLLILSGNLDLWAFLSAILVGAFVIMLPVFRYVPAIEKGEKKTKKKR